MYIKNVFSLQNNDNKLRVPFRIKIFVYTQEKTNLTLTNVLYGNAIISFISGCCLIFTPNVFAQIYFKITVHDDTLSCLNIIGGMQLMICALLVQIANNGSKKCAKKLLTYYNLLYAYYHFVAYLHEDMYHYGSISKSVLLFCIISFINLYASYYCQMY